MNLHELSWPQVADLPRTIPVVIPIAAVEQHGRHLPLMTDSMLLGEVWRRAHAQMSQQVLSLPLQWLGNSHHHMDFQGTLSAEPQVYLDLLRSKIDNLVYHGFQRILILNGHGGNDVPGKQVVFEAKQRYRNRKEFEFLFATYWGLGTEVWPHASKFEQQEMGHACEWETSMMLRLAPQLVGDYRSALPVSFAQPHGPAYLAWTTQERSIVGHIGSPHLATEEKGELLFERFSNEVVKLLKSLVLSTPERLLM